MAAITASLATGIGYVVATQVVPIIVQLVVSVVLQAIAPAIDSALSYLADLVASNGWLASGLALAILSLGFAILQRVSPGVAIYQANGWMSIATQDVEITVVDVEKVQELSPVTTVRAIVFSIISLITASLSFAIHLPGSISVLLDVLGLGLGLLGLKDAAQDLGKVIYGRITLVLGIAGTVESTAALVGDLYRASKGS